MSRNALVAIILVLVVALAAGAVYVYREQHRNTVDIQIGPNGLKVDTP